MGHKYEDTSVRHLDGRQTGERRRAVPGDETGYFQIWSISGFAHVTMTCYVMLWLQYLRCLIWKVSVIQPWVLRSVNIVTSYRLFLFQELAKYEECENQVTLTEKGESGMGPLRLCAVLQVVFTLSSPLLPQISWRMDLVTRHFTIASLLRSRRRTAVKVWAGLVPGCDSIQVHNCTFHNLSSISITSFAGWSLV